MDESPGSAPAAKGQPLVTLERVEICRESALRWSQELPAYADEMQRRADWYAILAGLLAAVTSLSVWATLAQSTQGWAQGVVAVVGIMSGLTALVPRIKNYGEEAGQARQLSSHYGRIYGKLVDATPWAKDHPDDPAVRRIVDEFEDVKADKDKLRYVRQWAAPPPSRAPGRLRARLPRSAPVRRSPTGATKSSQSM